MMAWGLKRGFALLAVLVAVTFVCFLFPFSVFAADGSAVSSVTDAQSYKIESCISLMEKGRENASAPIRCFDISPEGNIALCFGGDGKKSVLVLDAQAKLLYGYDIELPGEIALRLTRDGLTLYMVNSRIAVTLDKDGGSTEKLQYSDTDEADKLIQTLFYQEATEKVADDGTVYRLVDGTSDVAGMMYGKLVKVGADGEESVFYEATVKPHWAVVPSVIGICASAVAMVAVAGIAVYRTVCRRNSGREDKDGGKGDELADTSDE